ncbi:MAG: DUF998 domain-containing protein [Pseudonocardia sp.]
MRSVPWWAKVSAAAAPALLIGGWTVAAARQPGGFDPVAGTISALAAHGATDRWVMTAALGGVGVSYVVTALGLRDAVPAGRVVLGVGGVATVGVAAFPLPETGDSAAHAVAAGIAFVSVAAWPAVAGRSGRSVPAGLRRPVALAAAAVLLGLVGWFAVELNGPRVGLAERVAAGAQALWPFAVVLTALPLTARRRDAVRGP